MSSSSRAIDSLQSHGILTRILSPARLLWLVLVVLLVTGMITHLGELRAIVSQLKLARPQFVVAAVLVQALFVFNLARFFVTSFHATGLKAHTPRFVLLTSASYLINLVSKTSGLGGLAIYIREAERNNDNVGRVSAAYLLTYIFGYAVFYMVLLAALVAIALRGSLTVAEASAAGTTLSVGLVLGVLLLVALRSADAFEGFLLSLTRGVNRMVAIVLRRRALVEEATIRREAREVYEAVRTMKKRPVSFLLPLLHALALELLSALSLFLVAHALHANINLGIALIGYVLSLLFSMIAFTPAGLGLVEASLSVLLISFGVPKANAIAIAVTFRLFDFWLPVLLGVISLVVLRRQTREAMEIAE
jgi:uncharacterized protein (TIRG00374 family)